MAGCTRRRGYLEDGQLVVIDRLKDVLRLADGTQFSPQFIENRLKFSPYVKEAVVIGQDKPYLARWCASTRASWGSGREAEDLLHDLHRSLRQATVYDLLQREIDRVNQTLPRRRRSASSSSSTRSWTPTTRS